ncbi:hypothetical protein [Marmoricola sp. OAE513]|uniref:hypothetical protein n=1 Tax=Marmoricola sp. OAE513 TaxID=2817894 RepID=UPI001AE23DA4
MSLSWNTRSLLFALGAVAGLVGDRVHVDTFTTRYADSAVPVIGSSPLWFPLATGVATVVLAETRLRLPSPRTDRSLQQGIGAVAAVLAIYALTGILHGSSLFSVTVLILALSALTWATFGDVQAAYVGLVAALVGPVLEMIGAATGLFSYASDADSLGGVAPWLPGLYFAFGVTAAVLGELGAARTPRVSATG